MASVARPCTLEKEKADTNQDWVKAKLGLLVKMIRVFSQKRPNYLKHNFLPIRNHSLRSEWRQTRARLRTWSRRAGSCTRGTRPGGCKRRHQHLATRRLREVIVLTEVHPLSASIRQELIVKLLCAGLEIGMEVRDKGNN